MRVVLKERRTPWRLAGGSVAPAGRLSTPSSRRWGQAASGRALPALDHRGSPGGAPALRVRERALGGGSRLSSAQPLEGAPISCGDSGIAHPFPAPALSSGKLFPHVPSVHDNSSTRGCGWRPTTAISWL